MAGPTRIRQRQVRVADNLDDTRLPPAIALALPSSITQEDLQVFLLSRIREVIFGSDTTKHWYDDFQGLGVTPLVQISQGSARRVGVILQGAQDGVNRAYTLPDKFLCTAGVSIDVFHNGRRLMETKTADPRAGDFWCTESGGPGTGFDTVNLLSFTPNGRSRMVADYQVA